MSKSDGSWLEGLVFFLKGLFMGSADIVPGVSGGTIALITGIYERLILALKSIDFKFVFYFFYGFYNKQYLEKAKKNFLGIDFGILIPLAIGVFAAFLILANVMDWLLVFYPTYTYSFFFGLIFSSAIVVYVSNKSLIKYFDFFFLVVGFIFGFLIVGVNTIQADHSLLIIFLSGMITFCAMILPGISGAFILLLLGQYEFMLGVLKEIAQFDFSNVFFGLSYVVGGLVGLIVFSRVLSFLFKRYHGFTLMFVVGLMLGALRDPLNRIVSNPANVLITVFAGAVGVFIVVLIGYLSIKKIKFEVKSGG